MGLGSGVLFCDGRDHLENSSWHTTHISLGSPSYTLFLPYTQELPDPAISDSRNGVTKGLQVKVMRAVSRPGILFVPGFALALHSPASSRPGIYQAAEAGDLFVNVA